LQQPSSTTKLLYPPVSTGLTRISNLEPSHLSGSATPDEYTWTYIWGSAKYTSSKFYNLSFSAIQAPTPFKWIWDSKVSKKIKIFIWLLFRDRINSRNLLKRKNYKIEGMES
jgi:hypothetical protein